MAVGYIYILSNAAMGGLLKIGFTSGSVETRARELSAATGVPGDFVVEYFHMTDDVEQVERLAHADLAEFRHNTRREFFSVPIIQALNVIQRYLKKPAETFLLAPERLEPTIPKSACHRCGFAFFRSNDERYCPKCGF